MIQDIVASRNITEVVHFTTNYGLAGVLATGALKTRKQLPAEKYLEHIYKPNCSDRSRDQEWHDYVHLSISRINTRLFNISSGNWHRDIDGWWCVLSFRPEILTHEGVIYTTTNNIYTGVQRSAGQMGLRAMFSPRITQWVGNVIRRPGDLPENCPTCVQAEVLYPGELPIDYLQCVYLRNAEHEDNAQGIYGAFGLDISTVIEPSVFGLS